MSRVEAVQNRKVAVLATHPIQYQAPLWRKLAHTRGAELHVYYGAMMGTIGYVDEGFGVAVKWDVALTDHYPHTFLEGADRIRQVTALTPSGRGLERQIAARGCHVLLVNAYSSIFWLRGLLFARLRGIPVVMRHEASDVAVRRGWLKAAARDLILRMVYSQVGVFACIGTESRRHLTRLGVAPERLVASPYCIDTELFETQFRQWHPLRQSLRSSLGVSSDGVVLLFCGKLVPKKNPLLLLEALRKLDPELRERIHLVILGSGELQGAMESAGAPLLADRLKSVGFVNQSEMGKWYAVADCLVLPSSKGAGETWGLVVNEALQFGVPAIVSDGVGCAPDLIEEGKTGFVFHSGQSAELAALFQRFLAEIPDARGQYHVACRRKAAEFSAEQAAEGLRRAFDLAATACAR